MVIICQQCGQENPVEATHCANCAQELVSVCSSCQQVLPLGSKFCNHCGAPVLTALIKDLPEEIPETSQADANLENLMPRRLEDKIEAATTRISGERRIVTILRMQLGGINAGSTTEIEEVYLLLDQLLQSVVEVIHEYEGHLDFLSNDTVQALFGAPFTHENDAERALRAAWDVLARVRYHAPAWQPYGINLKARIGVNSGKVIAGHSADSWQMDYTIVGDTVRVTQQLVAAAPWDSVLVSEATYRQTRSLFIYQLFEEEDESTWGLDPVSIFLLMGIRQNANRSRGLPGLQAPMIGREEALSKIWSLFSTALQTGEPQVVMVSGEAGVGKSRLVWELRTALSREMGLETAVYEGHALSYARSRPYWVIIDLLRNLIGVSERDSAEVQYAHLRRYLQQIHLWQEDVWPYLTHLLGIKYEDLPAMAAMRVTDAGMLQRLTFAALRRVLLAEATVTPVIFVFEDMHWVDKESWTFIRHFMQSVDKVNVLMLLVVRDEQDDKLDSLRDAMTRAHIPVTHIPLLPLDPGDTHHLVEELIPFISPDADLLITKIVQLAAGNPFYTEEIIRILIEGGGIVLHDNGWQVTDQAEELMNQAPDNLRGMILARFDRLSPSTRRTLQKASVLGAKFPTSLLAQLKADPAEEFDEDLAELVASLFLLPQMFGVEPGYTFRHALVQEVVYDTLLQREQQRLHAQAALAIEMDSNWTAEEKVELLAYHYARSTQKEEAIVYLLEAADQAARRYANETAVNYYRQILKLLGDDLVVYSGNYFRARIGLGQSLKQLGEYSEAREVLTQSLQSFLRWSMVAESSDLMPLLVNGLRELADTYIREGAYDEAISHLEAGIEALSDAGRERHMDLWLGLVERLAFVHMRQGKLDSAFAMAHMGTTEIDLRKTRNLVAVADLYNTLGGIAWQQGNLDDAIFYVGQSLDPYNQLGYGWGTANAYSNLGILHAQQGNWQQTLSYWLQALQIRQEIGDYHRQAFSLANLAQLRLQMGDFDQARQYLNEACSIFDRMGDNWGLAQVFATRTELALARDEVDQGVLDARRAVEIARDIGSQDSLAHALSLQALVQARQNQPLIGLKTAKEALAVAKTLGLPEVEADCLRTLGILYLALENVLEAETTLRESLELSRQIKDPYRQGLVLLELGRLYYRLASHSATGKKNRYEVADQLLREADTIFRKLGAAYDLSRLEMVLRKVEKETTGVAVSWETAVSQPPVAQAEKRKAVILWADLIIPPGAGEEPVFTSMSAAISAIGTIVKEHKGVVRQHPQGIEAIFGAPISYEDDIEQATQAAFTIFNHIQRTEFEVELQVKIAITQGEVLTGAKSARESGAMTILGQPLEQVQGIAAQPPPGKIWVTEEVQRASRRLFTFNQVSAPPALGPLWELVEEVAEPLPKRGLPDRPSRFVGRDASLRQMLSLSLNLARGIGGWFLIEGEAGIGKSRLLQEFQASVMAPGRQIWSGSCSAQRANQPFHLFTDLLNRVFQVQPTDSAVVIRQKMAETMRKWPRDAHPTSPYLEILMGLQPEGIEGERLNTLEPDQLRQQIFVAVRRLMKAMAKRLSMVLMLDDLHWIDPVSAELLFFLAPLVTSDSILFVGAQRRQGADLPNDRLIRLQSMLPGQTIHMMLQRLPQSASRSLVQDLFATDDLPADVTEIILDRSEGNPYFIEEYVRMFIENGYVEFENGRWQVGANYSLWEIELPSSLDALIRARIDALPPELREVLQCAAVIGRQFETDLLASLTKNPQVRSELNRLALRLMIVAESGKEWRFSHTLFESIVYNTMLKKQRQQLHGQIAVLLEEKWQHNIAEHTTELAYHFTQAGAPEKAIPYLLQNAEQATSRYANEEALTYYQQVAGILQKGQIKNLQWQWRLAVGLGSVYRLMARFNEALSSLENVLPLIDTGQIAGEQAANVYWELGQTLRYRGEFDRAREFFQKALLTLGNFDDDAAKASAARVFTGMAWVYWAQGDLQESRQACKRSLELAQEVNSISERAAVENILGGIYFRQGDWRSALHHTTRAMVLREQMGYSWGVAASLSNLGMLAVVAGHWHKAESFFKRSLALRQEIGDIEGVVIAQNNLGNLLRDQGDLEKAEKYLRESVRIASMFNMRHHLAVTYDGLAEVLLLQRRPDAAEEMITAGLQEADSLGAQELLAYIYRVQAEIFIAKGQLEDGLATAMKAVRQAAEMGNRSYEAAGWRAAALASLRMHDLTRAQEYVNKASEILAETMDELGAAMAKALSARIHLALNEDEKAEGELWAARNVFTRLGARLYLTELDEIAGQKTPV